MKKLILLLGLLLAPSAIFAQGGSVSSGGILVLSPLGRPIGGATVTVCAFGATGIPCSPTITVYTDPTLVTPALNPATSDGNGSVFVYAAPGSYTYTVTGTGITGKSFTATVSGSGGGNVINGGSPSFVNLTVSGTATLGNGNGFAPVTFSNHNGMFWAGPGALPTIDQAVTACGANPCMVEISPLYTGPESANLLTTSTGYLVYSGAQNVTIVDMRQNSNSVGNPALTPLYPIHYGGRWDGELSREAVNGWCASPLDSCVGLASAGWLSGTWPTNNGSQYGSTSVEIIHGANTIGNSLAVPGASDSELWIDPLTIDRPILDARAHTGQVLINRANATGTTIKTAVYHATNCLNQSSSGALMQMCYGFDADPFSGGSVRNYSYHHGGNDLFENNSAIDAVDNGFTIVASPTGATESSNTVTITTSVVCNYTTGTVVHVAGVGVATYNGDWVVLAPGCNGGSTFTYTNPTSGLAGSGAGTTGTNRRIFLFGASNNVDFQPLADLACCGAASFNFKNRAGTPLFSIFSNRLQSAVTHEFFSTLQIDGASSGSVNLAATATGSMLNMPISNFPNNTAALTADWTCGTGGTVSSCVAATIIGSGGGVPLTFTLPLFAASYTLECDGVVGQATAVTANNWNLLTATNGATNTTANFTMSTAASAMTSGATTDQASTTTTFNIGPTWTLGAIATKMPFHIWAKIEGASASGTVVSVQLVAPTVADLVTIYRGAACRIF